MHMSLPYNTDVMVKSRPPFYLDFCCSFEHILLQIYASADFGSIDLEIF